MISKSFNFKTYRDLVTVLREFHLNETHLFSLLLNTLSCHKKYLCNNLFNINETHLKLTLKLTLAYP